jgi:hypothetical protein
MRLMRIPGVIVALALFGGLLAGCGQGADPDSPYQGSYRSTYEIRALNETGVFAYTVEQKGGMRGSFVDSASGKTYAFDGKIDNNGTFNGTTRDGSLSFPTRGTYSAGRQTSAGGNFEQERNGVRFTGSFVVSNLPIEPGPGNSFGGSYRGTYGMPERNESGNISFTVSRLGDVIGFISQSNNSPVGTISGTVDALGAFTCTVSYQPGLEDPYRANRNFVGRLAQSTVSGQVAGDFQMRITTNSNATPAQTVNTPGNFEVTIGAAELDSNFRGSYGGGAVFVDPEDPKKNKSFPGYFLFTNQEIGLPLEGGTDMTVDLQGDFIGAWGGVAVSGRISNDGRFTGTFGGNAMTGKLSKQQVPFDYSTTGVLNRSAGIAGNFIVRVNGVDYTGSFIGAGGTTQQ